jgi:hypothetical protein
MIILDTNSRHQKKIKQPAEKAEVARSARIVPGLDLEGVVPKRLADAYESGCPMVEGIESRLFAEGR